MLFLSTDSGRVKLWHKPVAQSRNRSWWGQNFHSDTLLTLADRTPATKTEILEMTICHKLGDARRGIYNNCSHRQFVELSDPKDSI